MTSSIKRFPQPLESSPKRRHTYFESRIQRLPLLVFKNIAEHLEPFQGTNYLSSTCRFVNKQIKQVRRLQKEVFLNSYFMQTLSPLAPYTQLRKIVIHQSHIRSLDLLSRNVTSLDIRTMSINSNLRFDHLTNLRSLSIAYYTQARNRKRHILIHINPQNFNHTQKLTTLKLQNVFFNPLVYARTSSNFPSSLTSLDIENCTIGQTNFTCLKNLKVFHLQKTSISTTQEDLAKLVHITDLKLIRQRSIRSDAFLTGMTKLEKLSLDLKLPSLPHLQSTCLTHLSLDLSLIEALPSSHLLENLTYASLCSTPITALDSFSSSFSLRILKVNFSPIHSLEPLRGLKALEELYCFGTNISCLDPLTGLTNLKKLNLKCNRFLQESPEKTALAPLRESINLTDLDLSFSPIYNLAPLAQLPLRFLSLNRTHVHDITPLASLPLENLSISNSKVANLTPLFQTRTLQKVDFKNTRVPLNMRRKMIRLLKSF